MGAMEAIAMIGASFVLISLYRAISCAEKRYQTLWHDRRRMKFGGKRQNGAGRRCRPVP